MRRLRDSQRQKLYNAESVLRKKPQGSDDYWPGADRLKTVAEMQAYVNRMLASAWFRRRWPYVARRGIEVRDGRGRRIACATTEWATMLIKMPTWSRSKAVIIHEIAHHCADEAYGVSDVAAHGWQFAATFLELATHELGAESGDALKKSFKEHRVRYRAPRQRKPLTPEQRAVLVERMAAARDAKAHRAWAAKIG